MAAVDLSYRSPEPAVPPAPSLVALAGWFVPGLGYLLIGQRARAFVGGGTILALFLGGILIAGVRCVDVPGFDGRGAALVGRNAFSQRPTRAILDKPWFIPQVLAGPVSIVAGSVSLRVAPTVDKTVGRLWDIGTLYTAVAGMLNLLLIIDAAHRAGRMRDASVYPGSM